MNEKNPVKAIRLHCLDCMCGNAAEVARCVCPDCNLFPFRFGKNPYLKKREYTEEQKAAMAERLKKGRSKNQPSTQG